MNVGRTVLAILVAVPVLAACGGSDGGAATPEPATATIAPASTSVPTTTPTPAAVGEVARLLIPSLGVDATVERLGISSINQLENPKAHDAVGWYTPYSKPGAPGNSVWAGYKDGAFAKLAQVENSVEIVLVTDSGARLRYQVLTKNRYALATIAMGDIISPASRPPAKEWATFITSGEVDLKMGAHLSWDVLVAERVD